MSTQARTPRSGEVFDELALRLREMVSEEHLNNLSGVERFKVALLAPFTIGQVGGELLLTDGDPDFTIGETLRDRLGGHHVVNGDLVWVARQDSEFHAFDVVSR